MSWSNENNLIKKINYGMDFAYVLQENNTFLSTDYKVLQSQSDSYFVKCMKTLYNGKIQIYYLTKEYKPFKFIFGNIGVEAFWIIVKNLFENIIRVKNNGFLSCENIDLDFEHVYIDISTYKVYLVYVPVECKNVMLPFERELRVEIIRKIQEYDFLRSPKIRQLFNDISDDTVSLEKIYEHLNYNGTSSRLINDTLNGVTNTSKKIYNLKMVSLNAPVKVELEISKDAFVIGRKATEVDGLLSFSNLIGRKHCRIIRCGNQYYAIDLKSANGTYINGTKLNSEISCPIKNGDVIRLANIDFKVISY